MRCVVRWMLFLFFFFKQKTAYEMRISDWSSDVCSSDLRYVGEGERHRTGLVDHAAPVRVGRRQAKAEKAEHADGDGHIAHAQAGIDDQRAAGVDRKSVV